MNYLYDFVSSVFGPRPAESITTNIFGGQRRTSDDSDDPLNVPLAPPAVNYHGLYNQGATCYLNSVLQVLFMTEGFRAAVKSHTCNLPKCIDCSLKSLFDDLNKTTAHTNEITRKLGIEKVYEQQDAAEYFEKILRLTSPDVSRIFHGVLTHVTTCCACGAQTHTDGAFWHLPLALVDSYSEHYSVVDGVEEHFKVTHFSGENEMYCDRCEAKSDAAIKCVMKHHPDVLMLLLKRFRFDYRYMTYVKINQTVNVPYTLQIPENQTYELYAVVEHFGGLRFGHYTATIRDNESWYNFNDDSVRKLNIQVDHITKSNSAYLLFYKRKDTEKTPGGVLPGADGVHDQCQDALETREREEAERAAEVCDDRNDTTGIEDMGSDTQAIQDHVNKQDAQRREIDAKTDKDEKSGDEQSEKTVKSSAKSLNKDAEHQDNGGLDKRMKLGNSQQEVGPAFKNTMEGSSGAKLSRWYAKIIEVEIVGNSPIPRIIKTKCIKMETSQDGTKRWVDYHEDSVKETPDPVTDSVADLSTACSV